MNNTNLFSDDQRTYSAQDIFTALRNIGINEGDCVFVRSQLKYLGKILPGVSRNVFLQSFVDALSAAVGSHGHLMMPTFSYSFCKNEIYNPTDTPSTVGILTEHFRKIAEVVRSEDPIFSVAVLGPDCRYFTDVGLNCVGPDSIFEKLYHRDAKLIFIGERFDITYMHYVEQALNVPYRYIKPFSGMLQIGDQQLKRTVEYYVRDLNLDPRYDLEKIADYFEKEGALTRHPLGYSKIRVVGAVDAYRLIEEKIREDLSFLLTKPLPESYKLEQ